jgi:endoglycosylceramidase
MPVSKLLFVAAVCSLTAVSGSNLDRLHVEGRFVRDSGNRVVILRGVTTITRNNDGKPMTMTAVDYDRIEGWGFNAQQIRLEACKLGLLPPCRPDASYIDKIESWVALAEQRGIYTMFKVTTYDVPGLDFNGQFGKTAWDKFWDTSSGYQAQFIGGWKPVWQHFKGRASVVGYDILNEMSPGSNTPHFNRDFLIPFYRRTQAALREIDTEKIFMFQPALRFDDLLEPVGGEQTLFVPHYYPFGPRDPDTLWKNLLKGGELTKAPILVGEYGLPNMPFKTVAFTVPAGTPERDKADAALFDSNLLGAIKTWYTWVGNWSLLSADGQEHPRLNIFSRPFPQRTAGTPKGFSFDFDKHEWNCVWEPDAAIKAPTVVFVPLKRHFPEGFRIAAGNDLELETDRKAAGGLKAIANPRHAAAKAFHYDFTSEILTVGDAKVRSLKITRKD